MSDEQRAFLAAIKAEPENYLHRQVYADWLDEHDTPEEANRQRAFEAADRWLREFWRDVLGGVIEADWYFNSGDINTYDRFIEEVRKNAGDCVAILPYETPDEVFTYTQKFWECVQIVTGVIIEDKTTAPFRCSC